MAMKFRAHDTFFIRKGWLSKGMKHVHQKPHVFVDKEENPMDVLKQFPVRKNKKQKQSFRDSVQI